MTWLDVLLYSTLVLFVLVCVMLILIVLIQKGRGGGLSSAFSGGGAQAAFGTKTGDMLTWATSVIFGIFVLLAIGLNLLADYRQEQRQANSLMRMQESTRQGQGAADPSVPAATPERLTEETGIPLSPQVSPPVATPPALDRNAPPPPTAPPGVQVVEPPAEAPASTATPTTPSIETAPAQQPPSGN